MRKRKKSTSVKRIGVPAGSIKEESIVAQDPTFGEIHFYSEQGYHSLHFSTSKELEAQLKSINFSSTSDKVWIDFQDTGSKSALLVIESIFKINPLVLEDILNFDQRPKIEDYGQYLFLVLKMHFYNSDKNGSKFLETEQISILQGEKYAISFQEKRENGDVFRFIRERIKSGACKLRQNSINFLTYSLIDSIVDNYFLVLESIGERIDELEDKLIDQNVNGEIADIYKTKRELLSLRRSAWPTRELLSIIDKKEFVLVEQSNAPYFRDVYDHSVQIIDTLEIQREAVTSILEVYLSKVSLRLNEIMRVLTVIATIFMPLTFMSSIYGMNFKYMPELDYYYGYPCALLAMLIIGIGLFRYFKKSRFI